LKIYFVRHGESEANLLSEFSNTGWKHPLTEKGREQVETLAANLANKGIVAVYSSPIQRAVQSAEILAEHLGVPRYTSPALLEYSVGIYEGRSDKAAWDRYWQVIDDWFARGDLDSRMEEGESFNDMAARFVPFIEEMKALYGPSDSGIVLVGHCGTYRCVLPLVMSNIDLAFSREHALDHTSYVLAELRGHDLICLEWSSTQGPNGQFTGGVEVET
jgi:2,3-bisphosphoglycerate-dependent phosphoglycerate mutase